MHDSALERFERLALEIEERLSGSIREDATPIVSEYFPKADSDAVFRVFYPESIRPLVQRTFCQELRTHDYVQLSTTDLDDFYRQCARNACAQFFSGLQSRV